MFHKTKGKITIQKVYAVLFLTLLGVFASVTAYKLYRFYAYDVADGNEWTPDAGSPLETDLITNFFGKMEFINLNGAVRKLFNQREMNGVVKLENGYLASLLPEVPKEDLVSRAGKVAVLAQSLAERDIPLLYVMTPYVVSAYDPQLPAGEEEYGNYNADVFLTVLEEEEVTYLDLREAIHTDGIDQYELWYKTDHHWSTEGGFYAYTQIAGCLENMLDVTIEEEIKNIDNYRITKYENWHLGSNGQRTGIYYAGIDDFDLILPNFETCLVNGEGVQGTFEELLISYDALQNRNYESRYTYDSVLAGTSSAYENLYADNPKRILVIGDSMANAVNPYLVLSFHNVRLISAYTPERLTEELLDEYAPDVVILLHNPMQLRNPAVFEFAL